MAAERLQVQVCVGDREYERWALVAYRRGHRRRTPGSRIRSGNVSGFIRAVIQEAEDTDRERAVLKDQASAGRLREKDGSELVRVNLRVDEDLLSRLEALSRAAGAERASVIRALVRLDLQARARAIREKKAGGGSSPAGS